VTGAHRTHLERTVESFGKERRLCADDGTVGGKFAATAYNHHVAVFAALEKVLQGPIDPENRTILIALIHVEPAAMESVRRMLR
jgi:hypothetical protein